MEGRGKRCHPIAEDRLAARAEEWRIMVWIEGCRRSPSGEETWVSIMLASAASRQRRSRRPCLRRDRKNVILSLTMFIHKLCPRDFLLALCKVAARMHN